MCQGCQVTSWRCVSEGCFYEGNSVGYSFKYLEINLPSLSACLKPMKIDVVK